VIYEGLEREVLYSDFTSCADVRHCPYYPGKTLGFFLRCTRVLREAAPDLVLAHLVGNHTLVSWAAFLARVPTTYVIVHNNPVWAAKSTWKALLMAQLARPFCRGEIAVSESVAKALTNSLHLPRHRVKVISNGCDVEDVTRRAAHARDCQSAKRPSRILMVGSMGRSKDHPTLLKAIGLLKRRGRKVELWLVGDGRRRSEHETLSRQLGISDIVRFLGRRPDVPELTGRSDVLVHATDTEGFGVVLVEGMASGIPVVATDIPPCREVLDGGRCGVLVPPRDPVALAEAIESVLENEKLRRRIKQATTERVRSAYDIRLIVERYAQLLQSS
jgi:glycosyltransferase involved in cell wall biosynthesis